MAGFSGFNQIGTNINVKNEAFPSKLVVLTCVIIYSLINFIYFFAAFMNMPIFGEVINFGSLQGVVNRFVELFPSYSPIPLSISLLITIIIYSFYAKYEFPSFLTLSALIYNDIACIGFSVISYSVSLRQVYFTYAIVFIIPVLTNTLSSVFLFDDTIDLLQNKYIKPIHKKDKKKKKKVKGELQPTEITFDSVIDQPEVHTTSAAKAAEIAIPVLGKVTETDNTVNKEHE